MTNQLTGESAAKIERAFGGCHNCYGKGYSTTQFGGKTFSLIYCSCARGKQLERLVEEAKNEAIKEYINKHMGNIGDGANGRGQTQ